MAHKLVLSIVAGSSLTMAGCAHMRGLANTYQSLASRSSVESFRSEANDDEKSQEFDRHLDGMFEEQRLASDLRGKSAAERSEILRGHRKGRSDDDESLAGQLIGAMLEPVLSAVFAQAVKTTSDVVKTPFAYAASLRNDDRKREANTDYQALVESGHRILQENETQRTDQILTAGNIGAESSSPEVRPVHDAAFRQ